MTDVRSNMFGKYTENDVRKLREENRIMEMRWEVFEGLYDKARQELEKTQYDLVETVKLGQRIADLEEGKESLIDRIKKQDQEIEGLRELTETTLKENEKFQEIVDETVLENEKLHKQIALYIDSPAKEAKDDLPWGN